MEEAFLRLFEVLEYHVPNNDTRLQIYRDLMPDIVACDLADDFYGSDALFDQAFKEYETEHGIDNDFEDD